MPFFHSANFVNFKETTWYTLIKFILNNNDISTTMSPGMLLLDFIRYHQHLTGTKTGCNEGDCGACTILVGELKNGMLNYRSFTSCLTPLGNVHGKHIVTVEGINMETLNPIQQAMYDESATQCGFCTPGFVVSLAGFCLSRAAPTLQNAIAAIDGNICRCTGYKSIERAAGQIATLLRQRNDEEPAHFVAEQHILPHWFATIKERLEVLSASLNGQLRKQKAGASFVGGGTDVYVQQPDKVESSPLHFLFDLPELNGIVREGSNCIIGPSATVTDLEESAIMQNHFPDLKRYIRLLSSTPIRNMATIAGNFINASPIGDFTIFFLALDATLALTDGKTSRAVPLRQLYKGYKTLNKQPAEWVEKIWFKLPEPDSLFNFEKVSKRTNLDIASVNTAIKITVKKEAITTAHLSAGGVAPVPMFLEKTSAFLVGKTLNEALVIEATAIAQTEIMPISDARGTAGYKRLLLSQLIKAHFITLFPVLRVEQLLNR